MNYHLFFFFRVDFLRYIKIFLKKLSVFRMAFNSEIRFPSSSSPNIGFHSFTSGKNVRKVIIDIDMTNLFISQ